MAKDKGDELNCNKGSMRMVLIPDPIQVEETQPLNLKDPNGTSV